MNSALDCHNASASCLDSPLPRPVSSEGSRVSGWLHVFVWSVLCIGYVAIGEPRIWPGLIFNRIRFQEPLASTDMYLETLTGTRQASRRILQALAPLASDKPVVLILPDNGVRSAVIDQNLIYLSWPREVRWLCADSPHFQEELFGMPPSTIAAVVFWDVAPPPGFPPGIRLGSTQVLIPLSQAAPNQ